MSTGEKLVITVVAQVAFLIAGLTILAAWTRGHPEKAHLWMLFGASSLPWIVLFLNALRETAPVDNPVPKPAQVRREEIRPIPVYRAEVPRFYGVDVEDLEYFIRTICETRDWTQRTWRNVVMPSGVKCDDRLHRKMCQILEISEFLVGRKPRHSGKLMVSRPETILATLGLVKAQKEH